MKTPRADPGQSTSVRQVELLGLFEEDSLLGKGFLWPLPGSPSLIRCIEGASPTLALPQVGQPRTSHRKPRFPRSPSLCFSHSDVQPREKWTLVSHWVGPCPSAVSWLLRTMNGPTRVKVGQEAAASCREGLEEGN